VDFSFTEECHKDAVIFTNESSIASGTINSWLWYFGDSDSALTQNTFHVYWEEGNYDVELIAVSDSGCFSSIEQPIEVFAAPTAGFAYLFNCEDVAVTYTDTSSFDGNPITFWNWNFGDGTSSTEEDPVNIYVAPGDYNVQLVIGSSPNCSDTVAQLITINNIAAEFSLESACPNDSIQFTDLTDYSGSTGSTWYWNFGDGNYSVNTSPNYAYTGSGDYNVSLIVISEEGCIDTVEHTAQVYPVPIADFSYLAEVYEIEEIISFTDLSIDAGTYSWNFGDSLGSSTVQNPDYIYLTPGIFPVYQVISNQYGCGDTAILEIIIEGKDEIYPPKAPTAFTPNNDGTNDVYLVRGGPFTTLEFKVYNAWGELMFESTDQEIGWDGTYKGADQPLGVYVYTIKATTVDGNAYTKTGEVTLIR